MLFIYTVVTNGILGCLVQHRVIALSRAAAYQMYFTGFGDSQLSPSIASFCRCGQWMNRGASTFSYSKSDDYTPSRYIFRHKLLFHLVWLNISTSFQQPTPRIKPIFASKSSSNSEHASPQDRREVPFGCEVRVGSPLFPPANQCCHTTAVAA